MDASQIQQLRMDLCTNAWPAMPDGAGESVGGRAANQAEPGGALYLAGLPAGLCVHLGVRDSGSGMDEATRSPAFKPFFTAKPVDRAPGRGATFHPFLPAQGQPARQRPPWRRQAKSCASRTTRACCSPMPAGSTAWAIR